MDDGLRTSSYYNVHWYHKIKPDACPQDAMIENARKHGHRAFFAREVFIEFGRSAGKVTNQYGSSPHWQMYYDTSFRMMPSSERCVYEIIVGRCLAYLDIEWMKQEVEADLDELIEDFERFCERAVPGLEALGTERLTSSCRGDKQSFHAVFRMRLADGRLATFEDNFFRLYGLVAEFKREAFERARSGDERARRMFRTFAPDKPPEESMAVFDMKVYTRNRIFRTLGSGKLKDPTRVFVKRGDHDWCDYLATHVEEDHADVDYSTERCNYHKARRTKFGRDAKRKDHPLRQTELTTIVLQRPCMAACSSCGVGATCTACEDETVCRRCIKKQRIDTRWQPCPVPPVYNVAASIRDH